MTIIDQKIEAAADIPIVVDLDGTLIKIDSLHESLIQFASRRPSDGLRAVRALKEGRAAFKAAVADHVLPDPKTLPLNESVIEVIRQAKIEGRRVYLATAADRRVADTISEAIGLFDGVFASENGVNLKGRAKAERLADAFGTQRFDYIGNDFADLPVWQVARTAMIVGATKRKSKQITRELPNAVTLSTRESSLKQYLLALRPHQWLKNALVALPVIGAHDFSTPQLLTVLLAFISFSFGASSIYLINDMIDVPHDRAHPEKHHRPIAAGLIPVSQAIVLLGGVATLSIGTALALPWQFMLVLVGYFALSMSYSVYLKRKLMIDVVVLAALYGVRVLAGGAATGIFLSQWLVGFCFFIFLSLALVKRMSEMIAAPPNTTGKIGGRGYRIEDLQSMPALTAASGFVSVLVLALYINSSEVIALYRHPALLWGICILLVYWLGRVYFLTGRGEMNQDPVVFAATDRISLLTGVIVIAIFLIAL
jgi:4-hydroxybenzoate polyprenyltransferase/phosphoserine phosphatase